MGQNGKLNVSNYIIIINLTGLLNALKQTLPQSLYCPYDP